MTNPFDRTFFKFSLGFACILAFSFAVLYLAGQYGVNNVKNTAVVEQEVSK